MSPAEPSAVDGAPCPPSVRSMSPERIVRALNSVQASILRDISSNRRYVLPSKISEDARKLYTTMALKPDSTPYEIPQN